MMDCDMISPEPVNIYVHRHDNPEVKFIGLEFIGFVPCMNDGKSGRVVEWVKQTYSDDVETLQHMKELGVAKYSVSYPNIKFGMPRYCEL